MVIVFEILEHPKLPNGARRIVRAAPSYADAVENGHELFAADYEGCADFITVHGSVYCIQPEGFTVTGSARA